MIIENGYIKLGTQTAGGIDSEGYAVSAEVSWGSPVPCQFYANNRNNLGRSNGEPFTVASYVVLIEQQDVSQERVQIYDAKDTLIGEFSIISVTPLDCVSETQILV